MIVTVDEVKTHLRIQCDEEDGYLASLIAQAQAAAEDYCRTKFSDPAPEPVRLAVLLMVGFYYENRDIPDMTTYKAIRWGTRLPLREFTISAACRTAYGARRIIP